MGRGTDEKKRSPISLKTIIKDYEKEIDKLEKRRIKLEKNLIAGKKIKPCPFCGKDEGADTHDEDKNRVIRCMNCGAIGPWAEQLSDAIEAWNERQWLVNIAEEFPRYYERIKHKHYKGKMKIIKGEFPLSNEPKKEET